LGDIVRSHEPFASWGEPVYYRKVGAAKNEIESKFKARMNEAVGKPVVLLDLTNMKSESRKKRNSMFPDYYKIAVVFTSQGAEELLKGIQANRTTHNVPPHICEEMIRDFEPPSKSEGFDIILKHDNRARLPVFLEYAKGEKAMKAMHSAFEDSAKFLKENAGTSYALQSGSAVAAVGVPRATTDVDYLILDHSGIDSVPDEKLTDYGLARQQAARSTMRSFKHSSGADIDLDLPQSDLHMEAVQNAIQGKVDGVQIPVIPAAYLSIFKIQNASKSTGDKREKHVKDVKRVFDRSKPDVNFIRSHLTDDQQAVLDEILANPKFASSRPMQKIANSMISRP
jgi:hypothetical protein